MGNQTEFIESICSCEECRSYCKTRPCWPIPEEVQKLIDMGFGRRLMRDWWCNDLPIIVPAIKNYEGKYCPWWPKGICNFFTTEGFCELHNIKLKPLEGRISHHNHTPRGLHEFVAKTWNSDLGRKVVKEWSEKFLIE